MLNEEQKAHFVENSDLYTPEAMDEMIVILVQHEDDFLRLADEQMLADKQAQAAALHEKLKAQEQFREREIAEAEAVLEEELEGVV